MGIQVSFNYPAWIARYPEFASVSEATANGYFAEASIFHRNDGGGPVTDATVQLALLNIMTAHIAQRYAIINGIPASPLVGRISNATEGSVSVAAEMQAEPAGTQKWLFQTKYGSDYWFATAPFRTMRYVAKPGRVFDPIFPGTVWTR